jgi:hypothetical protein
MIRVKLFALLLGIWEVFGSSFISETDDLKLMTSVVFVGSSRKIPGICLRPLGYRDRPFKQFTIHYLLTILSLQRLKPEGPSDKPQAK